MVRTVDPREATEINAQKKSIVGISNVAELGAVRMEETLGKATLRDAAIGTGIAVDKMLALMGQAAMVAVRVNLPSLVERAKINLAHAKLDEITRRLASSAHELAR